MPTSSAAFWDIHQPCMAGAVPLWRAGGAHPSLFGCWGALRPHFTHPPGPGSTEVRLHILSAHSEYQTYCVCVKEQHGEGSATELQVGAEGG